jgi:ankyrin repeat protein
MYAAARGHFEVCKILLSAGANADCKEDTSEARVALLNAAQGHFPDVIALLLSHGASPTTVSATGANGIWYAFNGPGDAALTVRQLLKAGTPASMILSRTGTSLLHDAARFNQINSIPLLVKYGVEINARDKRGRTALHLASWYASCAMVDTLIENGADVHAKDLKGRCSLHIAAETMTVYFVKSLLDAGADINAGDEFGLRPLMYACKYDEASVGRMAPPGLRDTISMVGKLLEEGAGVNARSVSGFSALHIACMTGGRCDVVNVLISAGAKMEARNRAGRTPLHLAAMSDRTDVLRVLAGHGALVDTKDRLGQSALHSAAARGHKRTVHALLDLGVSDDVRDGRGRSALDAAARAGHTEVAAALLGHRDNIRRIGACDTGLLHSALAAAQRHGRDETVQFLRWYGASDSAIVPGIKPALAKRAISRGSDAVVGKDAADKTGEGAMDELIGGERKMVARLSGRRVRRSRSIMQRR